MSAIGDWFSSLGGSIKSLFLSTEEHTIGVVETFFKIKDDLASAVSTLKGFKTFEFDPSLKTRVISVPRAYEGIQDLLDLIIHGLRDKFDELHHATETLLADLEGLHGRTTDQEGPSGVANVASKFATIAIGLDHFQQAFHKVLELEQMLLDIKERLETLDDLFLPQDRPREYVTERRRKRV